MLQGLSELGHAYLSFMTPLTLLYGLGGAFVGIVMGILPGLSATLAIALLTTLTIKLGTNDAILVLICSYVGALYGGSRTAILLNIPGTAANAASCADGYALAKQGQAGRAIGIATSGAFVSTLFGVVCLAAFTPLLAEVALQFGAFEFFWLALFGVTMSGTIVGQDPLKGWLMGLLGLFVAQIGQEGLYAYDRFTFGWDELALGIPGSAPSAVLMAAMIIHGVQPGPMLMIQHPQFIYDVVAMTTLATITILLFGLFGVRPLLHILKVRRAILMPIVFLLCTIGAFATASRLFDVYAMIAIGIIAFFLRKRGYEMAPLVLGLVLGPLLDKSLRRGLVLSDGSLLPFFTRPIALAFALVTIFTILLYVPPFKRLVNRITGALGSAVKSLFVRRETKT